MFRGACIVNDPKVIPLGGIDDDDLPGLPGLPTATGFRYPINSEVQGVGPKDRSCDTEEALPHRNQKTLAKLNHPPTATVAASPGVVGLGDDGALDAGEDTDAAIVAEVGEGEA